MSEVENTPTPIRDIKRDPLKSRVSSRKFILSILLVTLATIFIFMDKATFVEWATFSGAVLGLYGTGNVWSNYINRSDVE